MKLLSKNKHEAVLETKGGVTIILPYPKWSTNNIKQLVFEKEADHKNVENVVDALLKTDL